MSPETTLSEAARGNRGVAHRSDGIGLALKDEDARYENVMELVNAVAEFTSENPAQHTLSTFLQEVALLTEIDLANADQPAITLMTLHASKDLEFPVVFNAGMEEGLFPLAKAAQDPAELEEERRLFYVGATRAEERLYLSHAQSASNQPIIES